MGTTVYLDCSSGISGDMTVAALLDAGANASRLQEVLATLPVEGFMVAITRVSRNGLSACGFDVDLDVAHDNHDHDMAYLYGHRAGVTVSNTDAYEHCHEHGHVHDHEHNGEHEHSCGHGHEHEHGHGDAGGHDHAHGHEYRTLADVTSIIEASDLSLRAKEYALRVFGALAQAEAKAHGATPDTVHFHEVGAVDSIVDICAIAVCLDDLDVDRLIVPSLAEGTGTVRCAHGIMPIPVPAVANLCAQADIVLEPTGVQGELVTPTGAAVVAALRTDDELPVRYRVRRIGIGAGKRPYEGCSGVVRALIIEPAVSEDGFVLGGPMTITKLETDLDDCSGEALGYTIDALMAAGAREAHAIPLVMKKGRPAYQLEVLCDKADIPRMEQLIFENTTTIGIRRSTMSCSRLPREKGTVSTPFGEVVVKRVVLPDGVARIYPEYDSVCAVAVQAGVSFQDVVRAVLALEAH